jgi:butyryl-CoA dehydrogenase
MAAKAALDAAPDASRTAFARGKLQAARYFFHYELPKIDAWLGVVAARDATCRAMDEAWF